MPKKNPSQEPQRKEEATTDDNSSIFDMLLRPIADNLISALTIPADVYFPFASHVADIVASQIAGIAVSQVTGSVKIIESHLGKAISLPNNITDYFSSIQAISYSTVTQAYLKGLYSSASLWTQMATQQLKDYLNWYKDFVENYRHNLLTAGEENEWAINYALKQGIPALEELMGHLYIEESSQVEALERVLRGFRNLAGRVSDLEERGDFLFILVEDVIERLTELGMVYSSAIQGTTIELTVATQAPIHKDILLFTEGVTSLPNPAQVRMAFHIPQIQEPSSHTSPARLKGAEIVVLAA